MNKGKQVLIGVLCEFEPGHEIFKRVLSGQDTARQLMQASGLTKADLLSVTEGGQTIFSYKQTWDHLDRLAAEIAKNGEQLTVRDFTTKIVHNKSALDHAESLRTLPRLFTPAIWKGRLAEMEDLWFHVRAVDRGQHDFLAMRRQVAQATNETLREDQLGKCGIGVHDMRQALRTGNLDSVISKLATQSDHIRKADLFLLDSDGETLLHTNQTWHHFDRIWTELARHGERLTKDDFLQTRGTKHSVLEAATRFDQLPAVFCADRWEGRAEEMLELFAALPEGKQGKVDIHEVLAELADRKYGSKVTIDESLTKTKLMTLFNGAAAGPKASYVFRPLGLKAVWQEIDDVRNILRSGGEKITLADLQSRSGYNGDTCLKTAIRFGHFEDVLAVLEESGETLSHAALVEKPQGGKSVLDLLIERNELPALLRPALWVGRSQELVDLWQEVPISARTDINFQKIHGEVNRLSLRQKFAGLDDRAAPKPGI